VNHPSLTLRLSTAEWLLQSPLITGTATGIVVRASPLQQLATVGASVGDSHSGLTELFPAAIVAEFELEVLKLFNEVECYPTVELMNK
jgi:hypothetical protein